MKYEKMHIPSEQFSSSPRRAMQIRVSKLASLHAYNSSHIRRPLAVLESRLLSKMLPIPVKYIVGLKVQRKKTCHLRRRK